MTSNMIDGHGSGLGRTINQGMAIHRKGRGEPLEELCYELGALERSYPSLELRRPLMTKNRQPAIHLVDSAEVRRNENEIGHLVLDQVIGQVFKYVPTLTQPKEVEFTKVYPLRNQRIQARFIILGLMEEDMQDLQDERSNVLSVIEYMAGDSSPQWTNKPVDMTLAYIPDKIHRRVTEPALEIIDHMLPISATLLPADY